MKINKSQLSLLSLLFVFSVSAAEKNRLHAEYGLLQNTYNQVRIPGDDGTKVNLRQSFPNNSTFFRLDYKRNLERGHGVRFLYAPLKLQGSHTYSKDINFNGAVFNKNTKTQTVYQFNSYRMTYFYQLIDRKYWKLNIGGTAKIRDANIALKQNGTKKNRTDLGFVPLFYLWSEYWLSESSKITFDFDGLAAPQGRAFDAAIMYGHRLSSSITANLGYRMLEGGADNDKVYTFAMINFYYAGIEIAF